MCVLPFLVALSPVLASIWRPFGSQFAPMMSLRATKKPPRRLQDGSKTPPRGCKTPPKGLLEPPRTPARAPRTCQGASKRPQGPPGINFNPPRSNLELDFYTPKARRPCIQAMNPVERSWKP